MITRSPARVPLVTLDGSLTTGLTMGLRWRMVADALLVSFATSTLCVLLPEAFPCEQTSVGWLEIGASHAELHSNTSAAGSLTNASFCMAEDFAQQINWTDARYRTCELSCLRELVTGPAVATLASTGPCEADEYSPLGSLLLQSTDTTIRALFMRGAPHALPRQVLGVGFAFWFFFTIATAGISAPLGLLVPLIIIGGCLGRLYSLWMAEAHYFSSRGISLEPGLFALLGSTSVLSGSGQSTGLYRSNRCPNCPIP